MNRVLALLVVLLVSVEGAEAAPAAPAPVPTATQESLVELLPARTRIAVIVRKNALVGVRDLVMSDLEMMRELSPYLEQSLGLDVTKLEGLVGFSFAATPEAPSAGIILRIPSASMAPLKLAKAGEVFGTPIYRLDRSFVCARIKAGLVAGGEAEVRAAVGVDRGREPKLAPGSALGRLLAADPAEIDLLAAVGPGTLPLDKSMGVEDALLVYRRGGAFELRLRGEARQLEGLRQIALGAMQMGLVSLGQEKAKQTATNDPVKGAAAIVAYHQAKRLFAELDPKVEGNALTLRYKLPDTQTFGGSALGVAALGVVAAIAIPAYQRYLRKSKAVEADIQLGRLIEGIRMLRLVNTKGKTTLHPTEWTPRTGCCGQAKNRCAPDPKAWAGPPWSLLGFAIDEPHWFQYRVQVDSSGNTPRYSVEARADLDCDGKFSSYKRTIGPDGTPGPLESKDETE